METEPLEGEKKIQSDSEHHLGKVVLMLFALVLLMVWSVHFTGPSGQSLDFKGFILFWLRELIILAFALIALFVAGVGWLKRRSQQSRGSSMPPLKKHLPSD
ncbi:MAG: hypothetical protein IPP88_15835 [Betaproteobacteria bacterium]|nr:hypothetical protein [Betaproteobacteria bacterium]